MKAKLTLLVLFCLSAITLSAQKATFGLQIGTNYSQITEVNYSDAYQNEYTAGRDPRGRPGIYVGIYGQKDLSQRFSLRGEIGYELLRFKSHFYAWPEEMRRLHHFKLGTQLLYRPISWWQLGGGVEIMHRSNETITEAGRQWGIFSGSTVEGIFVQPTLSSFFRIYQYLQLGMKINLPRIQSISSTERTTTSSQRGEYPITNEEQLLPYQLSLSIPLYQVD